MTQLLVSMTVGGGGEREDKAWLVLERERRVKQLRYAVWGSTYDMAAWESTWCLV